MWPMSVVREYARHGQAVLVTKELLPMWALRSPTTRTGSVIGVSPRALLSFSHISLLDCILLPKVGGRSKFYNVKPLPVT